MQALLPLMLEHRLIERMLKVIRHTLERVEQTRAIDPYFVDAVADFIRIYADRTHHGKEEAILFNELKGKNLSAPDREFLNMLLSDHTFGRDTTTALIAANRRYREGNGEALAEITVHLQTLVTFYPEHIKKEDEHFFPASRFYFSDAEDQALVNEFWEFDRKMIHEKYKALVGGLEEIWKNSE